MSFSEQGFQLFIDLCGFIIKYVLILFGIVLVTLVIFSKASSSVDNSKQVPITVRKINKVYYDKIIALFGSDDEDKKKKNKKKQPIEESKKKPLTYLLRLENKNDFDNLVPMVDAIILFHNKKSKENDNIPNTNVAIVIDQREPVYNDEIAIIVNCPGGETTKFGKYFTELYRLRSLGININIFIEEVAASGGYLISMVGHKIYSTNLAVVGSIGTVIECFNFHEITEKYGIKQDQFASGKYKRMYSQFQENNEEATDYLQTKLKETHDTFIRIVKENRTQITDDKCFEADHWSDLDAKQLGLIDDIYSVNSYLLERNQDTTIYEISVKKKSNLKSKFQDDFLSKISEIFITSLEKIFGKTFNQNIKTKLA